MKKILTYISALALSCGAMTSCDKWFDVEIRSIETEEDVFSSKDGILSVLANIYGRLPDDQGFNADVMNDWDESITDAYETREFLGSSHRRYWDYDLVREINLFIENLDKYSTQYLQPEDLAYFRAEGRFLRAYVYMQFAKNMGGVPLITRSFTFAEGNGSATYYQFPRNTEDSTYCFIIAECDSIKHDLDVRSGSNVVKNRASYGAALALKSRAALYAASIARYTPTRKDLVLRTDGWEASISWRDNFKLGGKDFSYNLKFAIWDNVTKVTKYMATTNTLPTNYATNYYEGMTLGELWGYTCNGLFQSNEEAQTYADYSKFAQNKIAWQKGDPKYEDLNGDGRIDNGSNRLEDHGDLSIIGNINPHYMFGVNLAANWNGIGLSVFLQGVMKRDWYPSPDSGYFWGKYARPFMWVLGIHNYTDDMYSEEKNNWDTAYWPRMTTYQSNSSYSWTKLLEIPNTRYKQNAAYLRVKNIQVDYTFPKALCQKIRLGGLKIYLSGENLFTFTPLHKYAPNFDPEALGYDTDFSSTAGDGYTYPVLKSVTLGVNITF